jgi:flagellar M-ring protein FliF
MDFLNTAYAQLVELFRTMTPGARVTAGLLLIVVVVSVGYLFTNEMSGPGSDLMHGVPISANQLPSMEAAFGKAKLTGYKIEGTRILVPRGQEAVYMAALADGKAIPVDFSTIMDDELNNGDSFGKAFASSKDKEQRRKNLIEKKLGLTISAMQGIELATVLYDADTKPGFNREKIITASVAVKPRGSELLDAEQVSKIRYFVAAAIAGLKPESVTISDVNGRTWSGNSENGGGAEDNVYVTLKRTYEQDLKAKILNALSLMNISNVTVEPVVVLDKEKYSRTHEIKRDPKTVPVRQLDQSTTRSQDSAGPAGRPGLAAQQPNTPAALTGNSGGSREEEEQSKSEIQSLAGGSEIESEKVGLTPKLARVSVGIPVSYFKTVWQQRNPAEAGKEQKAPDQAVLDQIRTEETAKIQKHVAQLLPPSEGVDDPTQLVTVTAFQDIPGKEIPAPSAAQSAMAWFGEYWKVLGMIGVAFFSLLMLRSFVRAVPSAPEARAMPKLATMAVNEEASEEPTATVAPRLKRFTSGPSLRDELSSMVKDDPDTAANILRGWISSSG